MENNVCTVEDPIEYHLPLINQFQVQERVGLTFSKALRTLLRQDPDVIMVGEVRDEETARTAIQAALTGHLVFSTLHTNDACSAITRLVNMGVEPYLIGAALNMVLAQRLVRRICAKCRQEYEPPRTVRKALERMGWRTRQVLQRRRLPALPQHGLTAADRHPRAAGSQRRTARRDRRRCRRLERFANSPRRKGMITLGTTASAKSAKESPPSKKCCKSPANSVKSTPTEAGVIDPNDDMQFQDILNARPC